MKKNTPLKTYKPYTPSRRYMQRADYSEITKNTPEKNLIKILKRSKGRDNLGRISIRHKGGGCKRHYRIISSLQENLKKPVKIVAIEYDPNRSARIALVEFENKKQAYILAPHGLKLNSKIYAQEKTPLISGNRLKLKNIPIGTQIHDIEIRPGSQGKLVKSAGSVATVATKAIGKGKRAAYVQVKLPSGEIRLLHKECFASIGQVSNINHSSVVLGKAGRSRWKGIRPVVRGSVMNPNDHPHGGGEGKSPIGLKHPKTPWGKPALGYKTRKNKKTAKFIIQRRKI